MARYRKKPVIIEAVQWNGYNLDEVLSLVASTGPELAVKYSDQREDALEIITLEGIMRANLDDWVIRGIKGELYPCKPDIFLATYEVVE